MRATIHWALAAALAAGVAISPAFGQAYPAGPAAKRRPIAPLAAGRALELLETMSPEEREKALAKLPPARRIQIEARLRRLEALPESERQQLRQRFQDFERLTSDRQDALRLEIQALRSMRPVMRRRRVMSQAFQRQYSSEEQRILRQALGFE
ncbi:MAG: DUF3106 domain-containing protein [Bryobacteraceae bacterium]